MGRIFTLWSRTARHALALFVTTICTAHASGIFISEYVEGSSYNKAIEIYNGTGTPVDLSAYELQFFFNGNAAAGRTIALSGTLAAGDVYVVTHSSASTALKAAADLTSGGSWYNGDDAVALLFGGATIDVIGQIGMDPGSEWGSGLTSTMDNTLQRKNTLCAGDADGLDSFDPVNFWDGYAKDTFTNVGSHTAICNGGGSTSGTFVHDVQGSGASSPMVGLTVTLEAVVVGDFQGTNQLKGFFIQEEDVDADTNSLTSEGLFVYDAGTGTNVSVGDRIRVTGTVSEFNGLTELTNVSVNVLNSGNSLPTAAAVNLPLTASDVLERYEGMSIQLPQQLAVTENYDLGRYGQVWLSSGGRLMQPTNIAAPGSAANAVQAQNDLNRILLDDGSTVQNPASIIYPAPQLTALNTLRSGDTVTGTVGVVDYSSNSYKVHAVQTPAFIETNARTIEPAAIAGNLRVASFNVLNYFNGDGQGGGFPTSRGASSLTEFQRQRDKIIVAINSMRADIIGLMEIENDGYGTYSAIQDLVNGLNAAAPAGTSYAFINPGSILGNDEIAVGIIYKTQSVTPAGAAAILDSSVDSRFNDTKNRPVLAQTFVHNVSNGKIKVAVNHLKSKGSACTDVNDPDTGDGQGNCNLTRTNAAAALVDWLGSDPTQSGDQDFLIIGDLNAYAKEDPITTIKNGGFSDLIDSYLGADSAYSYIFKGQSGYLDHALASTSLKSQVMGVDLWHINADEPRALDYNVEYKSADQVNSLYSNDAYRSSDHDPVIIGLTLNP